MLASGRAHTKAMCGRWLAVLPRGSVHYKRVCLLERAVATLSKLFKEQLGGDRSESKRYELLVGRRPSPSSSLRFSSCGAPGGGRLRLRAAFARAGAGRDAARRGGALGPSQQNDKQDTGSQSATRASQARLWRVRAKACECGEAQPAAPTATSSPGRLAHFASLLLVLPPRAHRARGGGGGGGRRLRFLRLLLLLLLFLALLLLALLVLVGGGVLLVYLSVLLILLLLVVAAAVVVVLALLRVGVIRRRPAAAAPTPPASRPGRLLLAPCGGGGGRRRRRRRRRRGRGRVVLGRGAARAARGGALGGEQVLVLVELRQLALRKLLQQLHLLRRLGGAAVHHDRVAEEHQQLVVQLLRRADRPALHRLPDRLQVRLAPDRPPGPAHTPAGK
eukprot:scaffold3317_cov288-Prasinococcus_capsulatus_cf.AAC.2